MVKSGWLGIQAERKNGIAVIGLIWWINCYFQIQFVSIGKALYTCRPCHSQYQGTEAADLKQSFSLFTIIARPFLNLQPRRGTFDVWLASQYSFLFRIERTPRFKIKRISKKILPPCCLKSWGCWIARKIHLY